MSLIYNKYRLSENSQEPLLCGKSEPQSAAGGRLGGWNVRLVELHTVLITLREMEKLEGVHQRRVALPSRSAGNTCTC